MNERIEQLMPRPWVWPLDKQYYTKNQMQEFALSIIRECATLADEPTSQPFSSYGLKIKKHFGVEE